MPLLDDDDRDTLAWLKENQRKRWNVKKSATSGIAVGRIVHYVEKPLLGSVPESPVQAGEMKHRAAIITEVLDPVEGVCLLTVFAPGKMRDSKARFLDPTTIKPPALPDLLVHTWHWPERV